MSASLYYANNMTLDLPRLEKKILKFWKKRKVFEKSLQKTRNKPGFVFFEGPPFANGLPGIHHLLARAFKDIILRYKTMRGFSVERRAGWDTHGLPTEMEAEKKLGIKSKKEIEKLGVSRFIKKCQSSVFTYKEEWEEFTERIGFWLDFKNAYITCDKNYIETLWWILKQIWQKRLLYEDYKVVPYCPRCGTSLSSHEVAQGYKRIKEKSIYVKLKVKNQKNTYLLAWTTTPWTLPGNVAVAVNPSFEYVKAKAGSELLILAEQRAKDFEVIEKIEGTKLLGLEYEPLYKFIKPQKKAYYVVGADFVSLEEGTGIVHIASAFGEEDMAVAKENDLPILMTVNGEGRFNPEIRNWAGMFVKEADPLIIEDLKKRKLLFKEEMYEHDYPFCWRCKTPLLYYAKNSWFIKITNVKKELIKNSQKINWEPDYIKKGRFGDWLKEVKDWNLSRERYWGTPLPIWLCQTGKNQNYCNNIKVIGSVGELEGLSGKKVKDLHRPYIDEISFKCEKCGGIMKRVPEVIDCWFDSGSMPFAQWHYPFEYEKKIDSRDVFPADFIAEGIDQTRGWFYTLLAVSTLLGKGAPYKNVICLGLVLDAKGQKMSKSRGNIIEPSEVMNKFGADCARFYFYTVNSVAEPKRFDFKDVQTLYRKFFDTFWQSHSFFKIYVSKKNPQSPYLPDKQANPEIQISGNVLDKWIVSRLEKVNAEVIENLDRYDVVSAARLFLDFVDDLSNWYIRRSRQRFKNSDKEAAQTLYYVLLKTTKLLAPFTPFFAEELYQELGGEKESVHLEDYPKPNKRLIDQKLEERMAQVRDITTLTLAQRAEAGIKVRQPLASLQIPSSKSQIPDEFLDLIKQETNVKKITFGREVRLDTKITKELEKEGREREWVRNVNKIRKKNGLTPNDIIIIDTTTDVADTEELKASIRAKEINVRKEMRGGEEIEINGEKHYIKIKKI